MKYCKQTLFYIYKTKLWNKIKNIFLVPSLTALSPAFLELLCYVVNLMNMLDVFHYQ